MTMRMLIDARHREETRVAVVQGNRIEEFDFESSEHKQLKGNIYLAKVTRVEPSLQAAFVDYGGNRHGFLAFSEIHPDYYQIPKEDREALLREEAEHAAEEARRRDDDGDYEPVDGHHDDDGADNDRPDFDAETDGEEPAPSSESIGGDHDENATASAARAKRMSLRRRYKIQDVIHRRQVLLVQVVKEERGNKGAALTTYLSLAGRYCVLMPNTTHGGGISRKISNTADRKRLKSILSDLALPTTMGCIVRTAGLQRTKTEIKRDFDYLARLWDEIRETTLRSTAPALIHNDSDLIKRAIRDIYNRDIDEIIVEGEDGYRAARDYMKLLMPSHAKRVRSYADAVPLYQRYGVEDQLAAMYQPVVQLKSGGYLVINPTEALVSIDINSGRSTREHGIEQTAVATNLEAAQEIARQLRLRDMAGLVVIDFIDMEHGSNVRKVEKAMKTALANDRARIQVGRISSFGLMEMSRQRLRTGVLEASTRTCPHCDGTGLVRTASSAALSALRMIEEEAARGKGSRLTLRASQEAAIYVLNRKRGELNEIEARYGVGIDILPGGEAEGARMSVEASGPPPAFRPQFTPIIDDDPELDMIDEEEDEEEALETRDDDRDEEREEGRDETRGDDSRRKRSRRRRGRKGRREDGSETPASDGESDDTNGEEAAADSDEAASAGAPDETAAEAETRRRNRRGRRGGRRRRGEANDDAAATPVAVDASSVEDSVEAPVEASDTTDEAAPRSRRRRTRKPIADDTSSTPLVSEAQAEPIAVEMAPAEAVAEVPTEKPKRVRKPRAAKAADEAPAPTEIAVEGADKPKRSRAKKAAPAAAESVDPEPAAATPVPTPPASPAPTPSETSEAEADNADGTPRRGWWQRTFGA